MEKKKGEKEINLSIFNLVTVSGKVKFIARDLGTPT